MLPLGGDDPGTILVTNPDIPVATFGEDRPSALRQAVDAIEAILASMMERKAIIALPSVAKTDSGDVVRLSLQTELKLRLYLALGESGLGRADLQSRLGWQRESVDRLFRLDHRSRIRQLDEAFQALGSDIDIHVRSPLKVA